MADDQIPAEVEANIDRSIDAPPARSKKRQPVYQVIGDSKIPISLGYGKVWKSRKEMALKATEDSRKGWEEAIRYFENDQTSHRQNTNDHTSGNVLNVQKLNDTITETENVVFANVTTMVSALYARNPKVESTTHEEEMKDFNVLLERLINSMMTRKITPGVNIKSKAKRCVVSAALTNRGYIELGYTHRQSSSEQALSDLADLSNKLEKAKDVKKIEEIEGKIQALTESIDVLQQSGPYANYVAPHDILVDHNAKEADLTDANWIMIFSFLPTQFLLAKYSNKKSGKVEHESIFKPTHVMKVGQQEDTSHDIDNFSLYEDDSKASGFGFENDEAFEKAKMTRVAMVWDKITRRVVMYNDRDWTWPIWVWDDPLQLEEFFPVYPLWYFENLDSNKVKGEVTYYLDQQDAINEITDEERRSRAWAKRNIFFNSNIVSNEDVASVLNGPDGTARGLKLPEDMRLSDVIGAIVPPGMNFRELFDKESKYRAIDRISSVGEALRGAQFKTNTTNDAVSANVSAQNMRIDEKSDQIEDWIGRIGWGLAQLALQFMDKETVALLVDKTSAEQWQNFTPQEIRTTFNLETVGGSGKKPTSAAKKEEALELGQVLGQFVNAAPGPVLKIMLEVFQEAFDEITIRDEDWDEILQAVTQQAQAKNPEPQAQEQNQGVGANGEVPQGGQDELQQVLDQLPPEVKEQVIVAIEQGMPPQEALQQAIQAVQQ